MISVMNALMETHAFAKYGIWHSEWPERAAERENRCMLEEKLVHLDH